MTGFFARLEERVRSADSLLCVGIDPRADSAAEALAMGRRLVAATAPAAAAFKPNAAFFEALGPAGIEALVALVAAVPEEIPVILDAKRGDIASSAAAYAQACFGVVGAGAVTLSPYLGRDAVDPFLAWEGRGVWVLCRTSNPSAAAIQDRTLAGGGTLAEEVARRAAGWAGPDRLGLVAGATEPAGLAAVRAAAPEHWILAPGLGAQGAAPEAVRFGMRPDGRGVLAAASRAIADAADPGAAAAALRDTLRRLRPAPAPSPSLATDLFDAECVQFGEFPLRSGAVSPVYVDLRRLGGDPRALRRAAAALTPLLAGLEFQHLAAVPYGALPLATALALAGDASLVWPRPEPKDHGTGARVEGRWRPGDRAVLVDDVTTSGASALEAAALLRAAGFVVDHLVVLVERDPRARPALAAAGITLAAVTTLERLVDDLASAGRIDAGQRRAVAEFLAR